MFASYVFNAILQYARDTYLDIFKSNYLLYTCHILDVIPHVIAFYHIPLYLAIQHLDFMYFTQLFCAYNFINLYTKKKTQ